MSSHRSFLSGLRGSCSGFGSGSGDFDGSEGRFNLFESSRHESFVGHGSFCFGLSKKNRLKDAGGMLSSGVGFCLVVNCVVDGLCFLSNFLDFIIKT